MPMHREGKMTAHRFLGAGSPVAARREPMGLLLTADCGWQEGEPRGAQGAANSATTKVWSEGFSWSRGSRSIQAPVERAASVGVARM